MQLDIGNDDHWKDLADRLQVQDANADEGDATLEGILMSELRPQLYIEESWLKISQHHTLLSRGPTRTSLPASLYYISRWKE